MNFKDLLPKNLPFNNEAPKNEYYFAINISPKEVVGSVWGIEGKTLKVINTSSAPYEDQDGLTEACNRVLDEALGDFQPEPTKILFGVPDSWLIDENLKDEYLNLLKRLVKELDVEPMAYVSTTHAICHLLQKQTGVPATAILIDTAGPIEDISSPLAVTIAKAGKIIGTKSVRRTNDLPQDIEKVLMGFSGVEVLPSKIALYGSNKESLEKYRDELTSYNWMSTLPFLHLPKVESLEDSVDIKAVMLAGASEINPDVEYPSQDITQESRKPLMSHDLEEPNDHQKREVLEAGAAAGAGFVSGDITKTKVASEEDLAQDPYQSSEEEYPLPQRARGGQAGVSWGSGSLVDNILGKVEGLAASLNLSEKLPFLKRGKRSIGSEEAGRGRALTRGSGIAGEVDLLKSKFGGKKYGILALIVLIVLVGAYVFLPKAKVTIYIDPHVLEKDAQVIADPSITSVDNANSKIPGKIVATDVSGADKGTASGTKQVGDPAKGTVDIYNKSDSPKTYSQGTTLTGPNNLAFTLDSSVTIASASADVSGTTYGKSTVNVTAKQIGPDSNLSSGTNLSISGDSANVVVDQALSGGTSQNVTVVTSDDQKRLLAQLASELRQKAQGQIQSQLSGDEKILPEALNEQITKTVYSKNIGDQASDFTLNLTIHYTGTAYSDTDLKTMVGKLVETNVPDGYQLNLADTQTQADVSKLNKDGTLVFLAKFKANLIPKIDTDSIKKQIEGKSVDQAASVIQAVNNVIGSDIEITPSIPGPLRRIPFLPGNISFDVTTK